MSSAELYIICEGNSPVECQLPKLNAAGSIPVPRFVFYFGRMRGLFLCLLIASVWIGGCATVEEMPGGKITVPKQGIYHKVKRGETIWRIAKMYDVNVDDIVRGNKIPNIAHIEKDQLLFIPGVESARELPPIEKGIGKTADFDWPLKGRIVSYFGDQSSLMSNNGIDIQAQEGEQVKAAKDGQVVFADLLNGYGYTVILDHGDDFLTVYAHNAALLVKLKDSVIRGTAIALAGANGGAPYLHFEIRRNAVATNPLYYLP